MPERPARDGAQRVARLIDLLIDRFDDIDLNGDGQLNKRELEAFRERLMEVRPGLRGGPDEVAPEGARQRPRGERPGGGRGDVDRPGARRGDADRSGAGRAGADRPGLRRDRQPND